MSPKPIKTAVIGVGLAGTVFHLPLLVALPDLFEVTVVVERNPEEEGGKARKFGIKPKVVPSIEAALVDSAIEFVRKLYDFLITYYSQFSIGSNRNAECNTLFICQSSTFSRKAWYALQDVLACFSTGYKLKVLVDKPITPTYKEAFELFELAQSKNLILCETDELSQYMSK